MPRRAGLITRSCAAQARPSRLRAEALEAAIASMREHHLWEGRADRLETRLKAIQVET